MLIYSKERLIPTDVNMMVIKDKYGEGYFYIHRLLYDQAVIINDIYGEDLSTLIMAITNSIESRPDVDYFFENTPSPIHVLGAFLLLVNEELTEYVDMVGAIHVLSGPVHLRNMLKVPFSIRNMTPRFSLSIKEEYQLAWDRFFQNVLPYSPSVFTQSGVTPMNGVMTSTVAYDTSTVEQEPEEEPEQEEEQELTGYEEYGLDAKALDFLMSDEDPFAELDALDDEEEEEQTQASTPITAPEPESEPEPEPGEKKPESLVDKLCLL